MSSVIDFLEKMGKDAKLLHAPQNELSLAMEQAHIEAPLLSAILDGDAAKLRALLNQGSMNQRPMHVVQLPVHEDDDDERKDDDKEPPQESGRTESRPALHVVAPPA
jgi:hypothetical protein